MTNEPERSEGPGPAWLLVFAGWLAASTQLAHPPAEADASAIEARLPGPIPTDVGELDLDRLAPRDLRRLPGIGPGRALAIANARWELGLRGAPEVWDRVPGIGEETVRAVRAVLAARASADTRSGASREDRSE